MKNSRFARIAVALAAACGFGGGAVQASQPIQIQNSAQSQPLQTKVNQISQTAEISSRIGLPRGGRNPYRYYAKDHRNQRQLRKHLRTNPSQLSKYGK